LFFPNLPTFQELSEPVDGPKYVLVFHSDVSRTKFEDREEV